MARPLAAEVARFLDNVVGTDDEAVEPVLGCCRPDLARLENTHRRFDHRPEPCPAQRVGRADGFARLRHISSAVHFGNEDRIWLGPCRHGDVFRPPRPFQVIDPHDQFALAISRLPPLPAPVGCRATAFSPGATESSRSRMRASVGQCLGLVECALVARRQVENTAAGPETALLAHAQNLAGAARAVKPTLRERHAVSLPLVADQGLSAVCRAMKHVDVAIVGGGVVGSATAYYLKKQGYGGSIAIFEQDTTYQFGCTGRSAGGIRQQFSTPENIALSSFGLRLIRNLKQEFGGDADVYFREQGYLILASQAGVGLSSRKTTACRSRMAPTMCCSPGAELAARFPWINTEGLAAGCFGLSGEGLLDPYR